MGNGCYDENGICVNCKKCHPCNCEIETFSSVEEPSNQDSMQLGEDIGDKI